jgi:hypothetical protein
MTYTLDYSLNIGVTGLSDLRAQLVDTAGSNSGSAISTGFAEIGSGCYLWHYAGFADGFRGGVKFYRLAAPSTVLAFAAINPEEAESVWTQSPRTLTQSAASIAAAVAGSAITIHRGDTTSIAITGLGNISARTKLWFTVKRNAAEADSAAIVQVTEAGGLITLNGAAGTTGDGAITIDDATTGNITITLKASSTALLKVSIGLLADVQMLTASGVTTLAEMSVEIAADITLAVS